MHPETGTMELRARAIAARAWTEQRRRWVQYPTVFFLNEILFLGGVSVLGGTFVQVTTEQVQPLHPLAVEDERRISVPR